MTFSPESGNQHPTPTPPPYWYEDEIDLREVLQALWQHRWRILGLSVGLALAALVFSLWMPKTYRTSALLRVRQPMVSQIETEVGFSLSLESPSPQEVAVLVQSPEVFQALARHPEVQRMFAEDESFSWRTLKGRSKTTVERDARIVTLQVSDSDPERAARLANLWAETAMQALEQAYGLAPVLELWQGKVEQARRAYEAAQQDYEQALSEDRSFALENRMRHLQSELNCLSARAGDLPRLRERVSQLLNKVNALQGETVPWLVMSEVMTAQAQVTGLDTCATPAVGTPLLFPGSESSRGDVRSLLQGLLGTLERKTEAMQTRQRELEDEIVRVRLRLEGERRRLREVRERRDEAWKTYQALLALEQRFHLLRSKEGMGFVVEMASEALAPEAPVSPRPLLNTALGLVLGVMLGVLWAFLPRFWEANGSGPNDEES